MTKDEHLLNRIEALAGELRRKTFRIAADFAISHTMTQFVETGCYRGIDGDGQSTAILTLLADRMKGGFASYEIRGDHIALAKEKLHQYPPSYVFFPGDSVESLSRRQAGIDFAYLDSYDFEPNNPGPAQRHQLAEVGALLGKMRTPGLILLDDAGIDHGGKTGLSAPFLESRGWKLLASEYQRIYIRK